jgi:hypothetical protein
MASATRDQAAGNLDAHAHHIDELHRKLAATPGVDAQRLQTAVDKYKAAYNQFRDDALGCMN